MTYRVELSSRAPGQLGGFPETALSALVVTMADVTGYPDDRLRTFPTGDPHVRRAEFGDAGLVTSPDRRRFGYCHRRRDLDRLTLAHHRGRLPAAPPDLNAARAPRFP